jgi:Icc-related predicted phosphoesterase
MMKLMALADLHCRADSPELLSGIMGNAEHNVAALLLGGDLTNRGLPQEARCLAEQVSKLQVPVVAVLGNHDYESGQADTVRRILEDAGMILLQGNGIVLEDQVGVVGVKGFCGGYLEDQWSPFGEPEMKAFVKTCIDEAEALEKGLKENQGQRKIALMHYSPVRGTLRGESPEGYIYQGAARLGEAAERGGANLILHGHAHFGSPFGTTGAGLPVYNVCQYVLLNYFGRAYQIIEL